MIEVKIINKGEEPAKLGVFKRLHPEAGWDKDKKNKLPGFTCDRARYHETQQHLRTEQGNICAYCEQNLLAGTDGLLDDCRIEHFHPKSQREEGEPNWTLQWDNLFAVCCGGNERNVVDAENRFVNTKTEHSCDVKKADTLLDDLILNPLNIPFNNIWQCKRSTGEISPNITECNKLGVSLEKAVRTIKELNLNTKRLCDSRKAVLNQLNVQITRKLKMGADVQAIRENLAKAHFTRNRAGDWPSFFSSVRYYLGKSAEQHISCEKV